MRTGHGRAAETRRDPAVMRRVSSESVPAKRSAERASATAPSCSARRRATSSASVKARGSSCTRGAATGSGLSSRGASGRPEAIQAGSAGAYYQSASLDGSRPATYFINLRDTFDRPKFGLRTLTHHEASPGHHLQVSIALESDAIPLIRRRGGFSAYSEGWALYTEQLADEMGMFKSIPLEEVGYLQSILFRATRLVVDSGLHSKRWSREKATDYFLATTGIARGRGQNEIDRYTVWPGQATSYKIGHNVWVDLRDEARTKAGDRWDPKAFHAILQKGAMPLTVLQRQVRSRMA